MLAQVLLLFAPPVFVDEEKTRSARLVYVILILSALGALITGVALLLTTPQPTNQLLVTGSVLPFTLVLLVLLRKGQVRLVSLIFSFTLWVMMTLNSAFSGGVYSPAFGGY